MIGTHCLLFLIFISHFSNTFTLASYLPPKLGNEVYNLLTFSYDADSKTNLKNNLEQFNWTQPAIAAFDKWMSKNWIAPELRGPEYYGKGTERKEVRGIMKKILYNFKARKSYIDYLCETGIKTGIYKEEDTEKIRDMYWHIRNEHSHKNTLGTLFNKNSFGYVTRKVDTAGLVQLKAISDNYLKDEKQKNLLEWDYYDE